MRGVALAVAFIVPICILSLDRASAMTLCERQVFSKYSTSQDLESAYRKTRNDPEFVACSHAGRSTATTSPSPPAKAPLARFASKEPKKDAEPTRNFQRGNVLVRHDFADIWLFQALGSTSEANGAELSFTSDRVVNNNSWAAHGMAAVVWQAYGDYGQVDGMGLLGISVAPYVQFDFLQNSNVSKSSTNTQVWTAGGAFEVGLDGLGGQHYLRARGAAVTDRIAETTTGSAVFEWIPVYRDLNIGSPSAIPLPIPIIYRFSPELKARYDNLPIADGSMTRQYEWRAGPEVTLVYKLYQGEFVPEVLKRLSGRTTYSWLYSATSGRTFSWLETSLTYNLDAEGHIGLSASYKKGRVEETGKVTDIYKISLSGKL